MIDYIIKKVLFEEFETKMSLVKNVPISDGLRFHIENNITLSENVFRIYSDSYFDLIHCVPYSALYLKWFRFQQKNKKFFPHFSAKNADFVLESIPVQEVSQI